MFVRKWPASVKPVGSVIIVHGLGEIQDVTNLLVGF